MRKISHVTKAVGAKNVAKIKLNSTLETPRISFLRNKIQRRVKSETG